MTNKIILSSFTSLLLSHSLFANSYFSQFRCGEDLKTGDVIGYCITRAKKQSITPPITPISSYKTLFNILHIDTIEQLYHDKRSKLFLDDTLINDYTLTYLFYNKIINYQTSLESEKNILADKNRTIVTAIDLGSESITLLHIRTSSQKDFNRVKKRLNASLTNSKYFMETITQLSHSHLITLKNISTSESGSVIGNNLNQFKEQYDDFQKEMQNTIQAIDIHKSKQYKDDLSLVLNAYLLKNNLHYILHHTEEFKLDKKPYFYYKQYNDLKDTLHYLKRKESNDINITKIPLPYRYKATTKISPIQFPPFSLTNKNESLKINYPRIHDNTTLTLTLQISEEIRRNGKILIESHIMRVTNGHNVVLEDTSTQIKLDTYVNYPHLLFNKIENTHIGSIKTAFKLDKYQQKHEVKGDGLIEKATCGYTISSKDNQIHFSCENIKLRPLKIDFTHKE